MNFYIAPWSGDGAEGTPFRSPYLSATGALDLRIDASQPGFGLFSTDQQETVKDQLALGDRLNGSVDTPSIKSVLVLNENIVSSDFTDVVWELMTQHRADCLMPTRRGRLNLRLGGLLIRSKRFSKSASEWAPIRARLRNDFARLRDLQGVGIPVNHHRKVLAVWQRKYGVEDIAEFGARADETPIRPSTVVSDDFNRVDSSSLGGSWTEFQGNVDISGNKAVQAAPNTRSRARHDTDLSTDDHYSEADMHTSGASDPGGCGVLARKDGTGTLTYYTGDVRFGVIDPSVLIGKVVANSGTQLAKTVKTINDGDTLRLECDGSDFEVFINGGSEGTATDTAITANLRAGVQFFHAGTQADNFEGGDLAAAAAGFVAPNPTNRINHLLVR